jgi:lipid-A-disaccharide synthase-like uncharacterized protein
MDWNDSLPWLVFGLFGQAAFFSRFLVQWIASERAGESYIPLAFWYLSLVGSLVLLLYAVHRREPVFLLGYLPNSVVYVRNIMLIKKKGNGRSASGAPGGG